MVADPDPDPDSIVSVDPDPDSIGSVDPDPDSIGSVDPDPDSIGSVDPEGAKMTHKSRNKIHVLKWWMFSLRTEGFCNLDILYGGLGIGKL
jgi:hypothetical protein